MLYLQKTQKLPMRHVSARLFVVRNLCFGKDPSSGDEKVHKSKIQKEKAKKNVSEQEASSPIEEESASAKLNRLLATMKTADDQINFAKRIDIVAKPGEANKKKRLQYKQEVESKDIFTAAKEVASMLGDEKKQRLQTESELLTRLLGGKPTVDNSTSEQKLSANEGDISLSELIVGMKIDRRQKQNEPPITRGEYVRRSIAAKEKQQDKRHQESHKDKRPMQRKREAELYTGSVNLGGGKSLGIFTDSSVLKDFQDLLPTWSHLHEQALKVQVSHPPANYFEKLAKWTEQGKIWRFPIDNEQDWLDEKDVDFSEHIFLEQHLEDWCPNRGPIRHFMELVCVGLSKNPYITAKEKKDHVMWYKNYFESKKNILKELMENNSNVDKNTGTQRQKQVEA